MMRVTICPRTEFSLESPVIAASGTLGYGTEIADPSAFEGLGAFVCKGTTEKPREGNEPIRLIETPAGMLNAIGLQNIGLEAVIRDKAPIWASRPLPVLVNISAESIGQYARMSTALDGVTGVAGIEVNVSCPNVDAGGVQFGTDPRQVGLVTRAVRDTTDLPVLVKLSPNVVDVAEIARAAEAEGADAVCVANTLYGMAIDTKSRRPALAHVRGGLSGPAIKPHFLFLVYQTACAVDIPVVGMGGVMTGQDAVEFMLAGATAVQLATALLVEPLAWQRVSAGIAEWMHSEGVRDLTEIIGAAGK